MKKLVKIIIGIGCIALLGTGIYVVSRMTKNFPQGVASEDYNKCVTDQGYYYTRSNHQIRFLDGETGTDAVVCNKPNCQHNSTDCNAYSISTSPSILSYGDYIYIDGFEANNPAADEENYETQAQIKEIKKDGSGSRIIYSVEQGSIVSMEAVNGVLYFTTWTYHGGYKVNEYHFDTTLYAYDLRWNRLRTLKTCTWDESHDNASLTLEKSDRDDALFLTYDYSYSESSSCTEIWRYDIDTEQILTLGSYDNQQLWDCEFTDGVCYMRRDEEIDGEMWLVIYKCDQDLENEDEIVCVKNGTIQRYDGYMLILNDDYNKFLYEYGTGKIYMANTANATEGTYISDVCGIDAQNNCIYIDLTDYTGYKPGDVFTSYMGNIGVTKWDEFLSDNFTLVSDVASLDETTYDWVSFDGGAR